MASRRSGSTAFTPRGICSPTEHKFHFNVIRISADSVNMGKGVVIASISSIVLTVLATVGWLVFAGGFGTYNDERRFFEGASLLSPEGREVAFLPFNSHYIVAVLSPILFIVMIVMSILTMVLKNNLGPCISAIMTIPILILGAFVMISSGVVFYLYSVVITRLITTNSIPRSRGYTECYLYNVCWNDSRNNFSDGSPHCHLHWCYTGCKRSRKDWRLTQANPRRPVVNTSVRSDLNTCIQHYCIELRAHHLVHIA